MSDFPKPKDAQDAIIYDPEVDDPRFDELLRAARQPRAEHARQREQRTAPAQTGVPAPAPKEAKHRKARVWDADEKIRREKQALEAKLQSHEAKHEAALPGRPPRAQPVTPPARPSAPNNATKATGGFSLGSCMTGGCLTVALVIGAVFGLAWWNNRPDDDAAYSYGAETRKTWAGAFYPDGSDLTKFLSCAGFASSQSACLQQCDQAAASYCEHHACEDVDLECWPE